MIGMKFEGPGHPGVPSVPAKNPIALNGPGRGVLCKNLWDTFFGRGRPKNSLLAVWINYTFLVVLRYGKNREV